MWGMLETEYCVVWFCFKIKISFVNLRINLTLKQIQKPLTNNVGFVDNI